ncbi:MGH1-like glycoside hydrolase domain-containing protein [Amycolatopsis sp. H20-H5]|uniref:MGH1-like glycoside hydrolase domain-containing protein n=1 Tax=Amycolatopsis sp. H20-H5 TaxID=3046309 RepID=UPI002DB7FD45|nr:trehalase family glycosidase [Amycolatopsis sp. H20-H5]MEC3977623.1 trehalase family glycosidase [Amycolatopsis sp. H20-H5]
METLRASTLNGTTGSWTTTPGFTEVESGLRAAATRVLDENWLGSSTVPSRGLYPHQWSWDSAFISFGLRHHAPERARLELLTLFSAQWPDGRVPHIVFNPDTPDEAYFPGPGFWHTGATSGLVQPPIHARAVWEVHQAAEDQSSAAEFLATLYPKLVAWHAYLLGNRDFGGRGLVSIVHPWESGMDNSPAWDGPLAHVRPVDPAQFIRRDLEHGDAADRPSDVDYGRYVRLAAGYRDVGYRDERWPLFGDGFTVEDPAFNALLADAELALGRIAGALGLPGAAAGHRETAARLTQALVETLWDDEAGFFFARDVRTGERAREYTCGGLIPLVLPGLPVAPALLATATGPRFGVGRVLGAPSYDLTAPGFDAARYWRGPSWFNVGWLVRLGLLAHGERALAERLRSDLLEAAWRADFAEYTDPLTGEGHGSRSFGWTAALTLDLLAESR